MDLPIIQLTATGESISGSRNAHAEELSRRMFGVEQKGQPERDGVLDEDRKRTYQTMFLSAFQ